MSRELPAGAALFVALVSACGIDLTDSLAGRPCAEGDRCLPGYVCVETKCVLAEDSGASAGRGGTSNDASLPGSGGAGSGGVSSGGVPSGGTGSGAGGVPDAGRDASSPPDSSTDAADAALDAALDAATEAGAGGSPGTGGVAGAGGTPAIGAVVCRHLVCTNGDACCISNWSGFPNVPAVGDFGCVADADTCLFGLECDGDHDCDSDEECCAEPASGRTVASCVSSCDGSSDIRVECTAPEHCDPDEVCCGDFALLTGLNEVRCASSCSSPDIRFCRATADCPSGQTCGESASLPGYRRCL